jgi:acetolactate decarboxylase
MFKKIIFALMGVWMVAASACGQTRTPNRLGHCHNPAFDREVAAWLSFSVPAIDVDSLRAMPGAIVLDAREPGEYAVSHIEGAVHCGYDYFKKSLLDSLDKSKPVVVYCSIGYRSEKIAQKLRKAGFTNVSNLYGSIFEWVNRGYPVVDADGRPTPRIHTYNRNWGRWVDAKQAEKVVRHTPAAQPAPPASDTITITGAMRDAMWKGEIYGKIAPDTLADKRYLYGIGPLEYLRGEILIWDGQPYLSSVAENGGIAMAQTWQFKAPFFAHARISDWSEVPLPDSVRNLAQLQQYLDQTTRSMRRPFFFRLQGRIESANIHIVNLPPGTAVRSPKEAHQGKKDYTLRQESVQILGFFSTAHQTIFTHHDTFLHLHLMTADRQKMGHVDEVLFEAGAMMLSLPR